MEELSWPTQNGNVTLHVFDCTGYPQRVPVNGTARVTIYGYKYQENFTFSPDGSLVWVPPYWNYGYTFVVSAEKYYTEETWISIITAKYSNITLQCLTRIVNQTIQITITDCNTSKPLSVQSTFEWATTTPPFWGNLTVPAGGKVNWTVEEPGFFPSQLDSDDVYDYLRWAINASGYLYYQNTSAVLNTTTSLHVCAQPPQDIYIDIQYKNGTSITFQNATEIKWMEACGMGCSVYETFHPPPGSIQWQSRSKLPYGGYGYFVFTWHSVDGYDPDPYYGTIVEIDRNTTQVVLKAVEKK